MPHFFELENIFTKKRISQPQKFALIFLEPMGIKYYFFVSVFIHIYATVDCWSLDGIKNMTSALTAKPTTLIIASAPVGIAS